MNWNCTFNFDISISSWSLGVNFMAGPYNVDKNSSRDNVVRKLWETNYYIHTTIIVAKSKKFTKVHPKFHHRTEIMFRAFFHRFRAVNGDWEFVKQVLCKIPFALRQAKAKKLAHSQARIGPGSTLFCINFDTSACFEIAFSKKV